MATQSSSDDAGRSGERNPVDWAHLAPSSRTAFEWAFAMEVSDVGTRTLLAGMIRSSAGESDPEQLLSTFNCPTSRLFTALQRVAPKPKIETDVRQPASLGEMPPLSPNGRRALRQAGEIRLALDHSGPVTPQHLFAAILDLPRSTAYRALASVIPTDLDEVSAVYDNFLRLGERRSFREVLLDHFPGLAQPPLEPAPPDQIPPAATSPVETGTLTGHHGAVNSLHLSPDGGELASAGADRTIRIWDLSTGRTTRVIDDHATVAQTAVAYSPEGRDLVAGSDAGTVWRWDRRDPGMPCTDTMTGHRARVEAIAFSAGGRMASADRDGRLILRSPNFSAPRKAGPGQDETWASNMNPAGHSSDPAIETLAFAAHGQVLASSDASGLIAIWDASNCQLIASLQSAAEDAALALDFFDDGRLAILLRDGSIATWEPDRDSAYSVIAQVRVPLRAGLLNAEAGFAVTASASGALRLVEFDGETVSAATVRGRHDDVLSLAASADGSVLVSGGEDGEIRVWGDPETRLDEAVDWKVDAPIRGRDRDELGRRQLAISLARRLDQVAGADSGEGESFLLHVDGPWGAGKSTVLSLLKDELQTDEWLVVDFDAWRQSRVGPPWWALLTSLRVAVRRSLGRVGGGRLRFAETLHRLRQYWLSYLLSLVVIAIAVLVIVSPFGLSPTDGVQLVSGTIALLTSIWLLARTATRSLMWESATAARLYEHSHQDPMESLARHFAWLMGRAGRRVVFFIDDLDRCSEEYVVDLLDSIQTLVRDAPSKPQVDGAKAPYFVIAADGRWIRCSYEHVYGSFEDAVCEPGRPLGYLFLDKIFQLSVQVPTIGVEQQGSYLGHLLGRSKGLEADEVSLSEGLEQISQSRSQEEVLRAIEDAPAPAQPELRAAAVEQLSRHEVVAATEHQLQKFAALLEPNPRSMKRFVNAYSVAMSTALLEERHIDPDRLALWTIMRMRWPVLAEYLSANPGEVGAMATDTGSPPAALPDALHPLVGDAALAAVVAFGDRPLDESAIRTLCDSAP